MQALIHADRSSWAAHAHDVAGRPLLVRQLQWLRDCGVERIAVALRPEVSLDVLSSELAREQALIRSVEFIAVGADVDVTAVMARAGMWRSQVTCLIPADVVGGADLVQIMTRSAPRPSRVYLAAPRTLGRQGREACVEVWRDGCAPERDMWFEGWGTRIRTRADALLLGALALDRRLPPTGGANASLLHVHAAERAPGVWIARGARVDAGAQLVPPVLVGPDALVRRGARVGPAVVLHPRSVVEPGATIAGSIVGAGVIVGEGVTLRGKRAEGGAVIDLASGARTSLHDDLLLTTRPALAAG